MSNINIVGTHNATNSTETLNALRLDLIHKQKKGLPFIMASVIIWGLIFLATRLGLTETQTDFIIFCCSCPLMPLAFILGRILKVDIVDKTNPLGNLGFLFTMNQMLYLLIVMWVMNFSPDRMVAIYAMVYGGHLLPYSWLYKSKTYAIFAILITIGAMIIGINWGSSILAALMIAIEILMSLCLFLELKKV